MSSGRRGLVVCLLCFALLLSESVQLLRALVGTSVWFASGVRWEVTLANRGEVVANQQVSPHDTPRVETPFCTTAGVTLGRE